MGIDTNKLKYIFRFMEEYLWTCIDEVLNDSESEPEKSAVAVNNLIKCYIDIECAMGENLPYNDVKSYFLFDGYTKEEYDLFEKKRLKESKYYKDIQY